MKLQLLGQILGKGWWKAAGLALAALLTVGMAPALGAAPATVRLALSSSQVEIGGTVVAEVWVEGAANLCGAEVHLSFDAAKLQVEDADPNTPGVKIRAGNLFPSPYPIGNVDNAAGTIDFASAQLGCGETKQPGVLARFTIKGIAEGAASINFTSVQLAGIRQVDVDGDLETQAFVIPAQSQGGSLVVTGQASPTSTPVATATPTPTPTATPAPIPTLTPVPIVPPVSTPTPAVTPTPTPCPI